MKSRVEKKVYKIDLCKGQIHVVMAVKITKYFLENYELKLKLYFFVRNLCIIKNTANWYD